MTSDNRTPEEGAGSNRIGGWIFSAAVAAGALFIFWDGLAPHRAPRRAFQFPPARTAPVRAQPAPMEPPPPFLVLHQQPAQPVKLPPPPPLERPRR